jgi:hypothetical protein
MDNWGAVMMAMRTTAVCLGLALLFVGRADAQTSYPMITHATPVAVQRGQSSEVVVEGQMNFYGASRVLVEGSGVRGEVVGPPPARLKPGEAPPAVRSVKLKLTVDADAEPGVREFRVATSLSLSSVGQLVVSEYPVVQEKGDNNTLEKANPIPVPCVVSGRIEVAEDVDYFKFHADAGQTFTFEVQGARIEDKIHDLQKHLDPMLTLYDGEGRELAANDDFYFADPLITYTFAKAGDYYIQVRDSKYDGDPRWAYALTVTDRPYATHVFPMAGNPGSKIEVEPVGSAAKVKAKVTVQVPTRPGLQTVTLDLGSGKTNPVPFIVSDLPQVIEQEPNDTPEQAMRVKVPCGINGRIGAARDLDHFVFAATKGKAVRFEVKARRFGTALQSSLDSVLDVMTLKGAVLASNDDAFGKDAALVFTPPADGDYILRIRDLNNKGGPTAVYYLEADWARPDFSLRCDGDKAMLAPGSRNAWYVQVTRENGFTGPVKVEVKGLPPGVTTNPLTIPATMTQGLLVVSADDKAASDAVNVEVVGSAVAAIDGKEETLVRRATPIQEIYLPGGGRGRFEVNMHSVAVTDYSDVGKVEVTPREIKLKPGEEVKIEVTVERRNGYDKALQLDMMLRHLGTVYGSSLPPGVTIVEGKSKTLLGAGNKGHIVLKAAPNAAPVENLPISVLAQVSINFVIKISYSSEPILVSVVK